MKQPHAMSSRTSPATSAPTARSANAPAASAAAASSKGNATGNIAIVTRYLTQQIRADPNRLRTHPEYAPLRNLLEDALFLKDSHFGSQLRLALGHGTSSATEATATTATLSTIMDTSSSSTEKKKKKRKRRIFRGSQETVDKLKAAVYDWDMTVGSAINCETNEPLDFESFCNKIGFPASTFKEFVCEDRSMRRVPNVEVRRPRPKKRPKEERIKDAHFASPTYSAKNKRINWSLPVNIARMRKAVEDWDGEKGDRIDAKTGKLLSQGTFSKKVGIPQATLARYVRKDKSKRQKIGCHVGGGVTRKCDPFGTEDAQLCVDMLKRAEKAGRKKSRNDAIEYVKMLRPDYNQAQAIRVLDAHVLAKHGQELVLFGEVRSGTTASSGKDGEKANDGADNQDQLANIPKQNNDSKESVGATVSWPGAGVAPVAEADLDWGGGDHGGQLI
mmetsp:Transcript_22732/g.47182  ORF Transcript_22732/g.47182 Transcript_22732/m.47182 type:complete len:446 (+) Transcript_22732:175-1512(+)